MGWNDNVREAVEAVLDDQRLEREFRERQIADNFSEAQGHFLRTVTRLTTDLLTNPLQIDGPTLAETIAELSRWNVLRRSDTARGQVLELAFE